MNRTDIFVKQLRLIEQEKRTGSLYLIHGGQVIEIYFQNGPISAVSSNLEADRLGQHLMRKGFIDSRKLDKLLRQSSRRKVPLGETAVRYRVLGPSELREMIQRQAFELLR